jgi:hypothetical protein
VIRKLLLRIPIIGPWVERRWMPDPIERDAHREIVRARLEASAKPEGPADQAEPPQPLAGAPED